MVNVTSCLCALWPVVADELWESHPQTPTCPQPVTQKPQSGTTCFSLNYLDCHRSTLQLDCHSLKADIVS